MLDKINLYRKFIILSTDCNSAFFSVHRYHVDSSNRKRAENISKYLAISGKMIFALCVYQGRLNVQLHNLKCLQQTFSFLISSTIRQITASGEKPTFLFAYANIRLITAVYNEEGFKR